MTFGQAIQTGLRKYADFRGRASRPEFWWFILFFNLVCAALPLLGLIRTRVWVPLPFPGLIRPSSLIPFGAVLAIGGQIAMLPPTLAVAVRRLRDAGFPWTELYWVSIPIVGWVILIIRLTEPSQDEVALEA